MDSSNTTTCTLLQQEDSNIIRKRNRKIILTIFSLIFSLALIASGFIISSVHKNSYISRQKLLQFTAIRGFCYVSESDFNCESTLLSSAIKTTPFLNPDQILVFSLEKSAAELNDVGLIVSKNCWDPLRNASGRVGSGLDLIRVDPDLDKEKKELVTWIKEAIEDVKSCKSELEGSDLKARVQGIMVWLQNSRDFLIWRDMVNEGFSQDLRSNGESWRNGLVEDLLGASLFGVQYLVLVLLFCLLWRWYR